MNHEYTEIVDLDSIISDIGRLRRHLEALLAALENEYQAPIVAIIDCFDTNMLPILNLKTQVGNTETESPVIDFRLEIYLLSIRLNRLVESQSNYHM